MSAVPELTLYSARVCPWAQRVTLALKEVKAPHTHIEIDLQNKPSYYATEINPASKVPVLQVGKKGEKGTVLIPESHVLLELVADLYPTLYPETAVGRAEARFFIERYNQVVSPHFSALLYKSDESATSALLAGIKEIQTLLLKHDGPFVQGEKLSIGDLGVAPFIGRLFVMAKAGMLPGNLHEELQKDEYKIFREYSERLVARPSYQETFDEPYVVQYSKTRIAAMKL